jgi:hypothetical protein
MRGARYRTWRWGAAAATLALAAFIVPGGTRAALAGSGHAARAGGREARVTPGDDTTASMDNLRTGWDPGEPGLSPAVVHGPDFGEVFSTAVNGQVYAQPLVVGSTVIVATENNWVYGLNAGTGAIEWSVSLGKPYAIKNCTDLVPNVGITSTPVYDPSTGTAYVVATVNTGKAIVSRMFGIDVGNGTVTFQHGIYGSPSNDPHITINPATQSQRTGLLLLNGWVYAAFSSHCDHKPWAGYVSAIDPATRAFTLWTDESGAADDEAGIWQSGGGLVSDGPGRIFLTSGNGISPAKGPGNKPPGQLAESVIRLQPNADGTLAAKDFFSPADAPTLDANDLDYGAAGPAELPVGTTAYPHILAQDGKVGHIFLLNADNLGGREQGSGGTDNDLYQSQAYQGVWGHPAIFEASTSAIPPSSSGLPDYVYFVGKNDYLRAFAVSSNASGVPKLTDAANSTFRFGYGSGSPVVTSDGTDPSTGVVWVIQNNGSASSTLAAFPVTPQPATGGGVKLQEIDGEPLGTAAKFTIPATSNGMVYVGTGDGHVLGFGDTTGAALHRGVIPAFGNTAVGSPVTRTVTATAARTVTVTGVSHSTATAPDPFTLGPVTETPPGGGGQVPVSFPVVLHRGDTLHTTVTFTPTAPGGVSGTVSFGTESGQTVPVSVPLTGSGTLAGLYASTPHLSMLLSLNDGTSVGPVPVGLPNYAVATIANGGSTPQRITKVTVPGGPFRAVNPPRPGTVLPPGQTITVQFSYTPTRAVSSASSLTVTGSSGTAATVRLTGSSSPGRTRFTAPTSVGFGKVPAGQKVTRYIHIVNRGNQAATVSRSELTGPYRLAASVARGLPVNPGSDLDIPVTFAPAAAGYTVGQYTFRWTDRYGPHTLTIAISGTGVQRPGPARHAA